MQFKYIELYYIIFIIYNELSIIYFILFVNDMIIFENNEVLIKEIKIKLFFHFKMKDLRIIKRFLELEIEHNSYEDVIISQRCYIEYILKWFEIQNCKSIYIFLFINIQFRKYDYDSDNLDSFMNQAFYREIIESLNYLI